MAIALGVALALFAVNTLAQAPQTDAALDELSTKLGATVDLSEDQRRALSERLSRGAASLEQLRRESGAQQALRDSISGSEQQIADYKSRMQDILGAPATLQRRMGSNPSLNALDNEVAVVEEQRSAWIQERKDTLDLVTNRARTETELASRIAELSKQLQAEKTRLSSMGDTDGLESRINTFAYNAGINALSSELEFLEFKLRSGPTVNSLRTARVAWLDAATDEADALLVQLRAAAVARRQSAAAQRRAETRRLLSSTGQEQPTLNVFAQRNLALIDESQRLSRDIESARRGTTGTRIVIESIQQDAALTQRRLEVAGLEAQLGEVMISRLGSLPDAKQILAQSRERNEQIANVSIDAIDSEQAVRALSNRNQYLAAELGDRSAWMPATERAAERLYEQRRGLLQENLDAENTLLRLLVDENQATLELANVTEDYKTLLTANLLWVRNYSYTSPARLKERIQQLMRITPVKAVLSSWPLLFEDPVFLLLFVLTLVLLARRGDILATLNDKLGKPLRPSDESATLILQCLLLTTIVSTFGPLILLVLARALTLTGSGDELLQGLSAALQRAALALFALSFLTRTADRLGLGRRLLKWNTSKTDALTRDLVWFRPAITLALALTVFGLQTSPIHSGGGLAATGSFATSALLLIFALRLLRTQQFGSDLLQRYCLRAGVLIAASILLMHLSGQLFAAHLYLRALTLSALAVTATLVVTNVIQRLLMLYRANLERQARNDQRAREDCDVDELETLAPANDFDAVASLSDAYTQLLSLLRVLTIGALLWVVWSPALPALSVLDTVILWTTTDPSLPIGELRQISLSVLVFALFVIGTTLFITRQLPPLVNVVLMEFTGVSSGSRYAAGMLMQYLIIGIGFSAALVMLGFQWGKVQWLVAALGVGIGFGLQEIVANFISGLIVLFERPIRVGDIINAGGADGKVTRINARATVIETFEGKELMIPNKELITSVVTNWSLSSSKLRIVIAIGVAYGSDVDDAMRRLKVVAEQHREILKDPQPWVTFEDFGDNALVLWLRCYAVTDYPRVATELRQLIYREFNTAGISIAFPQRDIHIDASAPIPVRILPDSDHDPHRS